MSDPVPHQEHDVSDPAALARAVEALGAAPAVAVDIETDAMHSYRGRLCFVQLATAGSIWIVDTLSAGLDAGPLSGPFLDPAIRKVFHDAQGDLRSLAGVGLRVRGLFDTHRAATFLGLPRVGLGDLVEERFGVKLAKEHQTSDFGRRPLPPEVRAYVADDVRYLLPLAEQLAAEAATKGIAEELDLEFERIAEEATADEPPPKPKLPPAARNALGLAIAAEVDGIRHRLAAARNVPVGRILANAAVGEIALRQPRTREQLNRLPGVKGSFVREAGAEVLEAVARLSEAGARGKLPPPEPARGRPDPGRRDREARLKAFRAEAAKARDVTPSVILPTHLVEDLAAEAPADLEALARIRWLGEKRLRLYGEALLAAIRGDPPATIRI